MLLQIAFMAAAAASIWAGLGFPEAFSQFVAGWSFATILDPFMTFVFDVLSERWTGDAFKMCDPAFVLSCRCPSRRLSLTFHCLYKPPSS